jgi:riboflavin synthase
MFTGIIREIGTVKSVKRETDLIRFEIECPAIRSGIGEGDSIAIDGCDLTATTLTKSGFACDATKETLLQTTLSDLKPGSKVNLEPSLTPSTPISGHIVLGHIDGVGTVRKLNRLATQAELIVSPPAELMKFIARKGSITVSGVGLTVVDITSDSFSCWVIPYTLEHTMLGEIKPGSRVNIEVDVLARYIVRALESGGILKGVGITEEFLHKHGY